MVKSTKVWLSLSVRAQWRERKSRRSSRRRPSRLRSTEGVVEKSAKETEGSVALWSMIREQEDASCIF